MTERSGDGILPVALVTGAVRRIGFCISERLASAGYAVVLHGGPSSEAEAEQAAARIEAGGGRASALCLDLSNAGAVARLIGRASAPFGPLTLLVNNASVFKNDSARDFNVDDFDQSLAVNLRAPIMLARDFAAQAPTGSEAAIVNIIDQRVLRLTSEYFSYTLSKAALWTATQTMARAFAPCGLRVNAVAPGPVFPNTSEGEDGFLREVRASPLGRAVDPGEIADAVLYLARARSITGQMIAVDAGQHIT